MDDRSSQIVQEAIRRGSRSLLHYVGESVPWTSAEDHAVVPRLLQLIEEDREAAASLTRLLRRQRVPPPYLGPYAEHFTTMNYLSLDRLLPLLVEYQRRDVADLERSLAAVTYPEAQTLLRQYLELKRRHLAVLEELNKTHPQVGMRV